MNFFVSSLQFLLCLLISYCHCDELSELLSKNSACDGGWQPYKQAKCFKIFQDSGLKTFDDAVSVCRDNRNSKLVTITSEEENTFLTNLFVNNKIGNNFWIGMRFDNNSRSFKWIDESQWNYSNWAQGYPKNDGGQCVQVDVEESIGKWKTRVCWKSNSVVCQRLQTWPMEKMQQTVIELVRKLKENEEQLRANDKVILELKTKLNEHRLETRVKFNETSKGIKEVDKKIGKELKRIEEKQNIMNESIAKNKEIVEKELKESKEKFSQTEQKLKQSEEKLKAMDKTIFELNRKLDTTDGKCKAKFEEIETKLGKTAKEIDKKISSEVSRVENELKQKNDQMVKNIENVKKAVNNMVPVGFIYLQLPHQQEPNNLWPQVKWSDVSSSLAGVFFRVLGGNSAGFGEVQQDFSPRITRTETMRNDGKKDYERWNFVDHFPAGGGSTRLTGYQTVTRCGTWCNGYYKMRFQIADGEVRPKNVAIRVWKRVA